MSGRSAAVQLQDNTWIESWFDSEYYHLLYDHRSNAEASNFISKLIKFLQLPAGSASLDLGCGRGRHAQILAKLGFDVTGLDLSERSIQLANENYAAANLRFFVHDVRRVFKAESFDLALSLFTSFGLYDSDQDNLAVLAAASKSLKSGGFFVLDFLNFSHVTDNLEPFSIIRKGNVNFNIMRTIAGNSVRKVIKVHKPGFNTDFHEQVKLYERSFLQSALEADSLEVVALFGDYRLGTFDADLSDRLIFVCKKR